MPPFCEMTLRAVPSKATPPDLQFTVTLDGFNVPNNTLQLTRKAEIDPRTLRPKRTVMVS